MCGWVENAFTHTTQFNDHPTRRGASRHTKGFLRKFLNQKAKNCHLDKFWPCLDFLCWVHKLFWWYNIPDTNWRLRKNFTVTVPHRYVVCLSRGRWHSLNWELSGSMYFDKWQVVLESKNHWKWLVGAKGEALRAQRVTSDNSWLS